MHVENSLNNSNYTPDVALNGTPVKPDHFPEEYVEGVTLPEKIEKVIENHFAKPPKDEPDSWSETKPESKEASST